MKASMRSESERNLTRLLLSKLGNSWALPQKMTDALSNDLESGEFEQDDLLCSIKETTEELDKDETALQYSLIDKLIHTEVLLPHYDYLHKATVKGRHTDEN